MRILTLDLKAFGPFYDVRVDLSAGTHGLHMILGANEAGKTSAMRALSCLLFGFPSQTTDNFLHGYDKLRVGATLRHSGGATLELIRRKGSKNTLREADDRTIIPDERLERFIGAIDERTFESLFGIDHEKLAVAGEEIRRGQGLLGETLFAAGTGLAGLRKAQLAISSQLDTLFKARAQNPSINKALAELRDAKEAIKKAQLPSEDWIKQDAELTRSRARAAELEESLAGLRRARDLQIRIRSAIPQVARRRLACARIEAIGPTNLLRDGFGEECRTALEARRTTEDAIGRSRAQLVELDNELKEIPAPGPILEAETAIETVFMRLGAVAKALDDRENLVHGAAEHAYRAKEILRKLGRTAELEEAEALRSLRDDELSAIRALGQQESGLRAERDAADRIIVERGAGTARLLEERRSLGEPRDVKSLRDVVLGARKLGDLDERHGKTLATRNSAVREAERALALLPGWSGSLDDLERVEVPLAATLDRLERQFREDADARCRLDEKIAEGEEAIGDLTTQLSAMQRSLDVPTETDLRSARARRDEGWRLLRGSATGAEVDHFVENYAPGFALADAFEQAIRIADDLSDRLRREAEHVARKASLLARIEGHQASVTRAKAASSELRSHTDEREAEWRGLVGRVGIDVQSPAELRDWLSIRTRVLHLGELAHESGRQFEESTNALDDQFDLLNWAFESLGVTALSRENGFRSWMDRAEELLGQHDSDVQRCQLLDTTLANFQAEADRDRHRLALSEQHLAEWKTAWTAKLEKLGYEPDMTPAQADAILSEIQALRETMIKYRDQKGRVTTIERDAERFAADVAVLVRSVAPDLDGADAAVNVRKMHQRLKEAQGFEQRRVDLNRLRDAEAVHLRKASTDLATAIASLDRLCHEAGCETSDGLISADERWRNLVRLKSELRSCEEGIHASASGQPLEEFMTLVEQAQAEDFEPKIATIDRKIDELEAELRGVNGAMGRAQAELDRMDGGDHSASAAEESQAVLARLQGDVTRYATLRLADFILRRGIDRYREKNQGPILERASELFSKLTSNSFDRLQIDDVDGNAVLQGVRADGTAVGVQGLSDGSHDQLYLALRLASLESWLRTHEPIPLVVDDILLNFDDRRALAALQTLAELSQHTQVLFFTHHQHLVDLATACLPGDVLIRHELADPCTADLVAVPLMH